MAIAPRLFERPVVAVIAAAWVVTSCARPPMDLYADPGPPPPYETAPLVIRRAHDAWVASPRVTHGKQIRGLGTVAKTVDDMDTHDLDVCIRFLQQCACSANGPPRLEPDFVSLLQDELIERLIVLQDRPRLVAVFATLPINRVLFEYPEAALAFDADESRVNDLLTVLFEAYPAARSGTIKEALYLSIWRSFGDRPASALGDRNAYVAACRAWFGLNRDLLRISPDADNPTRGDLDGRTPADGRVDERRFLLTLAKKP